MLTLCTTALLTDPLSLYADNISSVYTSGRKCNFQNKGCDAAHLQVLLRTGLYKVYCTVLYFLQPININGWFWADGNKRIPPTNIPR